jgi:hypothetical protein
VYSNTRQGELFLHTFILFFWVSRLMPYRQVQNVSLLRHSVARLVGHLSGTWAKTVAYDVFPSVRARILTEALFMGGCFGGVMALWARARASRRLYLSTLLYTSFCVCV